MATRIERSKTRVRGFQSEEMDFQLIRQMGASATGAAAIGQCLALVSEITDGEPDSWVAAFEKQGAYLAEDAEARAGKGHRLSAYEQFLKACNAYRAAEYYTDIRDPAHKERGMKSRACFLRAMALADHTFDVVELPFEEAFLPAYFMRPTDDATPRKTVMVLSGFDGTLEESYFTNCGRGALERGYNLLVFAGPGQMDTMRFHPDMHFRPDFECATSRAVDYLLGQPTVDPERLGLLGISFGGYFATRSVAYEPRIKALVANSPIIDLYAYMAAFMPGDPLTMQDDQNFRLEDIPDIPAQYMSAEQKRLMACMMARFGRPDFKAMFRYMQEFRVGDALKNITCPCLALVGEGEGPEPLAQFERFCKGVSGPVASHIFTQQEGADTHCQVGNGAFSAAVTFDWMDEIL
ncbi:MAG: alpha/beta hydrolase [Spartobacteria bacterium]|nr:alpha/beta hydrolase [Spartobacteria bacterium]